MATRIGVDIGGTFTDLVFYDEHDGAMRVAKRPTTPKAPDVGVVEIIAEALADDAVARAAYFLHGTTVGLNALLERKGACVGLMTTKGFRDVLELRRGTRGEAMYDLHHQPRPPLVPRRLRMEIDERILADGTIEQPLDADDVARTLERLRAEGAEAIAISFLNAYAHPAHEVEAEQALRRLGFEGPITLSHRVSREMREFERTATTVVDAYVRPAVSGYLRRLDDRMRDDGFGGESLITRSGGGSMSFAEAEARPFETVMSGPVAGAVAAGDLARELGFARAITADVGGTSFDTCLLVDGRPRVRYEGAVGDLPLQTAWVDVRSIGSGGGSIAHVDDSALLRVGPASSGAVPGPVCYGRGGTRPTTTDAAAVLGMLGFGELAGGLRLDIPAARRAIDKLAAGLGLSGDEVASGVITIAGAAMAGAVRSVTIEQGEDQREAALISFGGAGPMLATIIASELDMTSIVIPRHAGNFSAWGLLGQDVTRTASASLIHPLDAAGVAAAHATLGGLRRELDERVAASGGSGDRDGTSFDVALELRYLRQLHSLTVPWPQPSPDSAAASLAEAFAAQYETTFGHALEAPVEIVAVRATLREALPEVDWGTPVRDVRAAPDRTCDAYSFSRGERVEFVVRDRAALDEQPTAGPLIVLEPTTTTYVDAGWTVRVGPRGALLIATEEDHDDR
ncbi:MAG: hydantoinase/oxoprolinase family protein [Actinobacteria bacterium]|nr:hydantoinase/oxoprolinase family protein [Actinomycetota bacterium]